MIILISNCSSDESDRFKIRQTTACRTVSDNFSNPFATRVTRESRVPLIDSNVILSTAKPADLSPALSRVATRRANRRLIDVFGMIFPNCTAARDRYGG